MLRNSRWCFGACFILLMLGCSGSGISCTQVSSSVVFPVANTLPAELPLPRYRFEVGEHLVYRVTESTDLMPDEDEDPDPPHEYQWDVYVTDQNDDGSWRLFIRHQVTLMRNSEEGHPEVRFENDILGYCDMHPDGRFSGNDLLQERSLFKIDPEQLFPPMPTSSDECAAGWVRRSPIGQQTRALKVTALQDGQMTFAGAVTSPRSVNYKDTVKQQVNFDLRSGFPTALARESKADWSVSPWHSLTVKELISVQTVSEQWLQRFRHEAQVYTEVASKWWQLSMDKELVHTPQECESLLAEARELLTQAQAEATLNEIVALYEAFLALHDREAKWALEVAEKREELYAMEALEWEATDFQGQTHRLEDYRGKVVLLDFWYRGCGHCIDAIPKIKRVAAEYAVRDIVILGMNKDRNDSDANYVIVEFGLKYPNLRAAEIAKQYQIEDWPTFIILDQSGRIAQIVRGNSESLYDQLSRALDRLLAQPVDGRG